jgi:ribosomal protein S7
LKNAALFLIKALYKVKLTQVEKYHKAEEAEKKEILTDPTKIFLSALENTKPLLKLTPVNKGGITYQVPVPMREDQREFLACKLLIESCRQRDRKTRFHDRFAVELIDAHLNQVSLLHYYFFSYF